MSGTRRRQHSAAALLVLTICAALAGCGDGSPAQGEASDIFSHVIQQAQSAGADQSQLDILLEAQAAGVLEFSDYLQAEDNAVACIAAAGIDVQISELTTVRGALVRSFTFQESPDLTETQLLALVDDCETRYRIFVLDLQVNQPTSVENFSMLVEAKRAEIAECLRAEGAGDGVETMSALELVDASLRATVAAYEASETARDCLAESGIAY